MTSYIVKLICAINGETNKYARNEEEDGDDDDDEAVYIVELPENIRCPPPCPSVVHSVIHKMGKVRMEM